MSKTYVFRGGSYPKDSVEVDTEQKTFYRSGGGFVQHILDWERFHKDFRPATKEELGSDPLYRKSRFSIETMNDPAFCVEGYTMGNLWNGWATPVFDKENAEKILKECYDCPRDSQAIYRYDENEDAFTWQAYDDEDKETARGFIIHADGDPVKVYPIGTGYWTWEEELK